MVGLLERSLPRFPEHQSRQLLEVQRRLEEALRTRDPLGGTALRLLLDDQGLSSVLLPLRELRGVPQVQEWHGSYDVLEHSLSALERVAKDAPLAVLLAVLYHDLGKKEALVDVGRHFSFRNHEYFGGFAAARVLSRAGFAVDVVAEVYNLIVEHMLPTRLERARIRERVNPEAWLLPLCVRDDERFEWFMQMHEADLSGREVHIPNIRQRLSEIRKIRNTYREGHAANEQSTSLPMPFLPSPWQLLELGFPLQTREAHEQLIEGARNGEYLDISSLRTWLETR